MKATGIVRRIDDLGRVVIPKEIRRTLGIREGEPLEIYTEKDMVCFKRYFPIDERQWKVAESIAEINFDEFGLYQSDGTFMKGDDIRGKHPCYIESPIQIDGSIEGYLVIASEGAPVKDEKLLSKTVKAIQKTWA